MQPDYLCQAMELWQQGDRSAALEAFKQAIQQQPHAAEAYYQRGLVYHDLGNFHAASFDYTQALSLNPDLLKAYYARALVRVALKHFQGAIDDLDCLLAHKPDYAAAYDLRGTAQRKAGNLPLALISFRQAAELYLKQRDVENSRRCLEQLKQLRPRPLEQVAIPLLPTQLTVSSLPTSVLRSEEFYAQALTRAETGDCLGALQDLDWALQLDPKDVKAYGCRGIVYSKQKNWQKAIADFNQALRLSPQEPSIHRNRGKTRIQLGDYRGAIADLNLAIAAEPDDATLLWARGDAYQGMQDYATAIADYTQAITRLPEHPEIYLSRAKAYACQEEIKQAIEDYQTALSYYCETEDWTNYHRVLDLLKQLQQTAPAKSVVSTATTNSLRQRLLWLVGGHWEIAERLIEQVRASHPGREETWYLEKVIQDLERDRGE
jgi:tetratricopeptide (TPR) repeat protein